MFGSGSDSGEGVRGTQPTICKVSIVVVSEAIQDMIVNRAHVLIGIIY